MSLTTNEILKAKLRVYKEFVATFTDQAKKSTDARDLFFYAKHAFEYQIMVDEVKSLMYSLIDEETEQKQRPN